MAATASLGAVPSAMNRRPNRLTPWAPLNVNVVSCIPTHTRVRVGTVATMSEVDELGEAVRRGEARALARAITLVESTRNADRAAATALIDALLPSTGSAARVGISGAPGSGKSTF